MELLSPENLGSGPVLLLCPFDKALIRDALLLRRDSSTQDCLIKSEHLLQSQRKGTTIKKTMIERPYQLIVHLSQTE